MPEPIELPKLGARTRLTEAAIAGHADTLQRAYLAGASLRAIASDTGRSYGWVHRTLTEIGTPLRGRGGSHARPRTGPSASAS